MSEQIQDVMALMQKQFDSSFNQPLHQNIQNHNFSNLQGQDSYSNLTGGNQQDYKNKKNQDQESSYQYRPPSKNRLQEMMSSKIQQTQDSPYKKKIKTTTSIQIIPNHSNNILSSSQINERMENTLIGQTHQPLDYSTLQAKIQSVLKKNQKYKDLSTTSRMTKNNSALMLSRFQEYQKKKQKFIQVKKNQLNNEQVKQLKNKPTINRKSQQIINQCGYTPIFERFQKLVQSKKKKQQLLEETKKQQVQKQYQKFIEDFKKHQKVPDDIRSYENFYQQMVRWKQRANRHTQQQKTQIQQKIKKTHPFKPQLNHKSLKIISNKARIPVHQRQIQMKQQQESYSFKPKINKKRVK